MGDTELFALAARQHSLVTWDQAREHLSRHQIEHRIDAGRLVPVRRGVLAVAGARPRWEQPVLAAVLAGGRATVASFRTAAHLWCLRGFGRPEVIEVTTFGPGRRQLDGLRAHRSRVDGPIHRGRVDGVPVTSVARTLWDLTARPVPPIVVERALDDGLRRGIVTLRALREVFDDLAQRGRRRSTVMRAILEARGERFHPGASEPELDVVRAVVRAGLPAPVPQFPTTVAGRSVCFDAAYPDLMIAIEYDSWTEHGSRSAFDHDRIRLNDVATAGWLSVAITSAFSARQIAATVGAALAARGAAPTPAAPTPDGPAPDAPTPPDQG